MRKYLRFNAVMCVCLVLQMTNRESYGNIKNFIKVNNASFVSAKSYVKFNLTLERCAEYCLNKEDCSSFVFRNLNLICWFHKINTKRQRLIPNLTRDYYEKKAATASLSVVYGATFTSHDTSLPQNVSYNTCLMTCYNSKTCLAILYLPITTSCIDSHYTYIDAPLQPDTEGWQYVEFNKNYNLKMWTNMYGVSAPIGVSHKNFQQYYFRIEKRGNSTKPSGSHYSKSLNIWTFIRGYKPKKIPPSRISCAGLCDRTRDCKAFSYDKECLLRVFY